jgi:uncharacterized DUF497 family protein
LLKPDAPPPPTKEDRELANEFEGHVERVAALLRSGIHENQIVAVRKTSPLRRACPRESPPPRRLGAGGTLADLLAVMKTDLRRIEVALREVAIYVTVDTGVRRWTWDPDKDAINRRRHKLPLGIGEVALADPLALSRHDSHPDGDRWDTLCQAGAVLLFIVHTWPDDDNTPGRMFSVRKATRPERKA